MCDIFVTIELSSEYLTGKLHFFMQACICKRHIIYTVYACIVCIYL